MNTTIPKVVETWMASSENADMLGWDMIVALPIELVNDHVLQALLRKFAGGEAPGGLEGKVEIPNSPLLHHLDGYRLASPKLEADASNYVDNRIKMSVSMEGGVHLLTRNSVDVMSLSAHTPLNALKPSFEVPITLAGGTLNTDLRAGSGHELTLGGGDIEDTAAGRELGAMLSNLAEPSAQLDLALLQPSGQNPLRRVARLEVRVQSSTDAPADDGPARQSLLLFVQLEHGGKGEVPVGGNAFPYLAGLEGAKQRCTVLVSQHLLHRVAFGQSIMTALQEGGFSYQASNGQPLASITATAGELHLAGGAYSSRNISYDFDPVVLPAATGNKALKVEFSSDQAIMRWQPRFKVNFRYSVMGGVSVPHEVEIEPLLEYGLQLSEDEQKKELLQARWSEQAGLRSMCFAGLPETLQEDMTAAIETFIRLRYLEAVNARFQIRIAEQLLPFLRLFDSRSLRWQIGAAPNNLVVVGGFDNAVGVFEIVEQEAQLASGQEHTFTVQPDDGTKLRWDIEPLPGYSGAVGELKSPGVYVAPLSSQFEGATLRVKVVATHPVSGWRSSALVCVNSVGLLMTPLFVQLIRGHESQTRVDLSVASAQAGELEWSIVDPVEGQSGTVKPDAEDASKSVFTVGPQQDDKTYVIDQVAVLNRLTGETQRGVLLGVHNDPGLEVVPAVAQRNAQGLQLEAFYGDASITPDWSWTGPGKVTDEGMYLPDPATAEHFVLIVATFERRGQVHEGHIVLPLPLDSFPAVRRAQVNRGRALRKADVARTAQEPPKFDLIPVSGVEVTPLRDVQFTFPLVAPSAVTWSVTRTEGHTSGKGTITKSGLYTAGTAIAGSDTVHATVMGLGSVIAEGASLVHNRPSERAAWQTIKDFTVKAAAFGGNGSMYPNGYQQLEIVVNVEAEGIESIGRDELETLQLYSTSTHQAVPCLEPKQDRLDKVGVQWAVADAPNEYDQAKPQGLAAAGGGQIDEKESIFLHSRAHGETYGTFYAGFRDRYGCWYYSPHEQGGGDEVIVTLREHKPEAEGRFDLKVKQIKPIVKDPNDEDYDFNYKSTDYWTLSGPGKYLECNVFHGGDTSERRESMVTWENESSLEIMASYTGFVFTPYGGKKPTSMCFDENLPQLHSQFTTLASDEVVTDWLPASGLVISNYRVSSLSFSGAKSKYVEKFKAPLVFELRDTQGNTTGVKVEYSGEGVRRRDVLGIKEIIADDFKD
ncbi:hypothetical protein [Pseudomonas xantholysinigenes]|uniref:Uncharacterized protein n=1 Tax=Pseudomonas xantholysinigenes TaxID=2745490 RepID=A0A9E6PZ96_9PSED|nr:hypothetical protein [Pseudomonas xantholysinigenes]QXI39899.1 hypothetical protein HU772_007390 [Pseudomonas xantholysinigenes]